MLGTALATWNILLHSPHDKPVKQVSQSSFYGWENSASTTCWVLIHMLGLGLVTTHRSNVWGCLIQTILPRKRVLFSSMTSYLFVAVYHTSIFLRYLQNQPPNPILMLVTTVWMVCLFSHTGQRFHTVNPRAG